MATRKINTFIEHLMNENLAATQAAVTAGTAVKQKKREQRDDVLRSAVGAGMAGAVNPFTVDKLKKKSPAAAHGPDSGPYGELNKAGGLDRHRDRMKDRMKKSTPSGSAGGY